VSVELGTPYEGLTPEVLFDALDAVGLRADGRLMALGSYENRVYQVGIDDGSTPRWVVVKVYRPGRWSDAQILEEHEFVAELEEVEVPVVAATTIAGATLHHHAGYRFAVYPRQGGRAPEFDDLDTLRRMGRLMARVHAVGARRPFATRPTLDIASFGRRSLDVLESEGCVPDDLRAAYFSVARQALQGVEHAWARAGDVKQIRLHGDCHAGNVLWTDDGPHFVDFDDARQGPAVQDLWMLFSGDADRQRRQAGVFLEAYAQFRDFDPAEWHLAEALRTLRLIHHAAWIAERWRDPAFPAAFSWFGTPRYWQDRILELREQVALLDEVPVWLA
jgi:Ser/Thr protein kinase RdoA (MazF antagonist)